MLPPICRCKCGSRVSRPVCLPHTKAVHVSQKLLASRQCYAISSNPPFLRVLFSGALPFSSAQRLVRKSTHEWPISRHYLVMEGGLQLRPPLNHEFVCMAAMRTSNLAAAHAQGCTVQSVCEYCSTLWKASSPMCILSNKAPQPCVLF